MKQSLLFFILILFLFAGCHRKQKTDENNILSLIPVDTAKMIWGDPEFIAQPTNDPASSVRIRHFCETGKTVLDFRANDHYYKFDLDSLVRSLKICDSDLITIKWDTIPGRIWRNGKYVTPKPSPIPDTTIKPRYEYGARYSIWMPLNKPYPPLDTINMVIEELLLDRTGREAAQFRAILSKQFASLLGKPTVDSVRIGGKP